MPTRPDHLADAAVTVLARDGLRGLTHRAVDAEAGLPHGSTSNYFRSRAALVQAIVTRLEELDLEALTAAPAPETDDRPAFAAHLAGRVALMASPSQVRATRARLALLLEETAAPALQAGHHRFLAMLESALAGGGHPAPGMAARAVADLLEGALVHAVSVDSRAVDVTEVADAVERLLR